MKFKKILLYVLGLVVTILLFFIVLNLDLIKRSLNTNLGINYNEIKNCQPVEEKIVFDTESVDIKILDEVKNKVLRLKEEFHIPALNVCLAKNGQIIWSESFGCKNIEQQLGASITDSYRIGSLSKSITAITLMSYVQQGKLDLNTNVQHYLPEFPISTPVTLGQLASHQSGIRHYRGFEMFSNTNYNNTSEAMSIFADSKLKFQPGTDFLYSTYGYTVIAAVLESVSEMRFSDLVLKEVCIPLEMINTRLESEEDYKNYYRSSPNTEKLKKALKVNLSNKIAGGGFLSASEDLVKMMINIDSILNESSQKLLFTPRKFDNSSLGDQGYGMGFRISEVAGGERTLIYHGGSSIGGRAFLLKVLEDDIVISICTNSNSSLIFPDTYGAQEVYDLVKPLFLKE